MRDRARLAGVVLLAALVLGTGLASSASASRREISKPDFIAKADAICTAANTKLAAAEAKLGANPTNKQVKKFVLNVLVPNIAGQLAKIRKLGFPMADKASLTALFTKADKDLARIKKNPALAVQSGSEPFADVKPQLRAYGLTVCGDSDSGGSVAAVIAAVQAITGHYQGPWTNTTFGSTGTVDLTIWVDTATGTVKVVTSITGNVFGGSAPPAETISVPIDPANPTSPVTVTSTTFGQITFSIQADGSLVADAPNLPSANAAMFHLVLKPSATGMDGTYTVKLRSATTANGTVALKKV